jgi:hypothetical membrane protein
VGGRMVSHGRSLAGWSRWALGDGRWTSLGTTAGITGVLAIALAAVAAALVYTGTGGEPYSPVNHWISELGEIGVSSLAPVFNAALLVGGLCYAAFIVALGAVREGRLRWAWMPIGAVAGIAGASVGVFTMNDPRSHDPVVLTYFTMALVSVGLVSLDFARRRDARFPRWLAAFGAMTVGASVAFLGSLPLAGVGTGSSTTSTPRPEVWPAALLEWLTIGSMLTWVLLTSLAWRRGARRMAAA